MGYVVLIMENVFGLVGVFGYVSVVMTLVS
jgi:hypothetical protein